MGLTGTDKKKAGQYYKFNNDGFLRSVPHDTVEYMTMLRETQGREALVSFSLSARSLTTNGTGFQEFVHERETKRPDDPSIKLFDEIILSKRNRGRQSFFSKSRKSFTKC